MDSSGGRRERSGRSLEDTRCSGGSSESLITLEKWFQLLEQSIDIADFMGDLIEDDQIKRTILKLVVHKEVVFWASSATTLEVWENQKILENIL